MSDVTTLEKRALTKNDWPIVEVAGLPIVRSPLLSSVSRLAHAFTTRLGGQTPAPLNWFNLGRHWDTEESRTNAMDNRQLLCEALGIDHMKLVVPGQQHTANILVVDEHQTVAGQRLPNLDGAATSMNHCPLLLHFADCVPVVLYDNRQHILCVMHAGWRGTAGSIAANGVKVLRERFHSDTNDMIAAVGPAIGSCCYPTDEDVAQRLSSSVKNWQSLIERDNGKPHPDLKAFNAMQLLESGVKEVDVTSWCTACHPEVFYSHRQSGGQTGRQGAIACIKDT